MMIDTPRTVRPAMALAWLIVMSLCGCMTAPTTMDLPAPARSGEPERMNESAAVIRGSGSDENSSMVAPVINLFGELDGVARPPGAQRGSAGFQQHTFATEGYDSDVSVDPQGKWLAFASTRHAEHTDIYLQRVDGTSVTQLTNDAANDAFPTFSPDGKRIAFSSTRSGDWDLYVMDTDGRNIIQVTSGPGQDLHPSFSPDGSRLAYCSMPARGDEWELWVVNLTTREKKMIGPGLFPCWSPARDGDRIAFQRARQRGSRWFSLWTLDLVDGEARRMTEVAVSPNAAIVSPAWSPDGRRLSFATVVDPAQVRASDGKPAGQQDVWVIDADGGNRARISDGRGANLSPWWSANNRIFFISDRGGSENVWSARIDGATGYTAEASPAPAPAPALEAVASPDVGDALHH